MSRLRSILLAALLVMATVVVPGTAVAQQGDGDCYPPGSPDCDAQEPDGEAAVGCAADLAARAVECSGGFFAPGTAVRIELRASGGTAMGAPMAAIGPVVLAQASPDAVLAANDGTTEDDGSFDVRALVPCDYAGPEVMARVTATVAERQLLTHTMQVDVSEVAACTEVLGEDRQRDDQGDAPGGGDGARGAPDAQAGTDDQAQGTPGDAPGALAFTGTDWLLLAALALALITAGTSLVRRRRERA